MELVKSKDDIVLGNIYTDSITNHTGICTAKIEYLNGCMSCQLTSRTLYNGKIHALWIDWQQLTRGVRDV